MGLHIVLVEPEIPQNTGNIARTCAAIGAQLHLIHPLGFSTDSKQVRRAGLDYWDLVTVTEYPCLDQFLTEHAGDQLFLFTTKAPAIYCDVQYPEDCYLLFGKESRGLPEALIIAHRDHSVRIPMIDDARSLNLSNTVAIAAYEYERQQGFGGLKRTGELHGSTWAEV
jgi:tRNA (cytidine/uridine-2'-O-)-methyltransferase